MFGLDLFHFSPPLEDAAEVFIIVLAAFVLSLLVFDFVAAARHHQRSHLEDGKCRPTVVAGRRVLGELQGSMSETEWDKKLKSARRKDKYKQKGPSKDLGSEEARGWGKNAPGEMKQRKEKKVLKRRSLYPVKELKSSELDSSETDELGSSEEEDLKDEAARYEEELHRVILIRFDRGRPPENLFRRIKQKDISMPMHSLMELM